MAGHQSVRSINLASAHHGALYDEHQIAHEAVGVLAAIAFIVGSALFFGGSTQMVAAGLFLVGAVLFAVRPLVRRARDNRLARPPEREEAEGGLEP